MEGSFTKEEIDEFANWFNSRELPKDLQINEAAYAPDLRETIDSTITQARHNLGNPTMYNNIRQLQEIKSKLEGDTFQ